MINFELIEDLENQSHKVYRELFSHIVGAMKEIKEVNVPTDIYDYDVTYTICYYGGRHPEYASDCFSSIERIYYDESDKVCVDLEDGSQELDYTMSVDDLFTIAKLIHFLTTDYKK